MTNTSIERFGTGENGEYMLLGTNHRNYESRDNGLYFDGLTLEGDYFYGALPIDAIPGMVAKLQAVYDEFEANKPAPEATLVSEVLDPLPNGSLFHFNDEATGWFKARGSWVSARTGTSTNFRGWSLNDWSVTVDYNPKA